MWADSLYFLHVMFGSIFKTSLLCNIIVFCGLLRKQVGLILIFQTDPVSGYICAP
jgi:hypothetical protein